MFTNIKIKPDIIIVDDHQIFRQGLKAIINFEGVGTVIGEASNGEEFIEQLTSLKPDLVLMDIDMPQMDGFEATQKALEIMPELKIIAFTVFSEAEYYSKMINIGAKGFILKSSGFNELEKAIEIVMKGENYFTGSIPDIHKQDLEAEVIDKATNKDIENSKTKGKMLFFPWIVNRKDSVNTQCPT
jgi:DNA-binding NarL/FixJ family response regulator